MTSTFTFTEPDRSAPVLYDIVDSPIGDLLLTTDGQSLTGLWMLGGGERLLERARPGVLFADLSACNGYQDGLAAAAKVAAPAIVIQGSRDLMTPAKGGKAVAAAIPGCRVATLDGAGHMLMSERPDDVLAALRL